jgi:hypothetical protein
MVRLVLAGLMLGEGRRDIGESRRGCGRSSESLVLVWLVPGRPGVVRRALRADILDLAVLPWLFS